MLFWAALTTIGRTIYSYWLLLPTTRELKASLKSQDVNLPVFVDPRCIWISVGKTNLITVSRCTEAQRARPDGSVYTHPVWALFVPKRLTDPAAGVNETAHPVFFEYEEAVVKAAAEAAVKVAADPKLMEWERFDVEKAAAHLGISLER